MSTCFAWSLMNVEKWPSPFLIKKCLQNIWLFVSKIGGFGHSLDIASLDFADFAYFDGQEWYLADLGGCNLQKKYLRLLWPMKTYFFVSKFIILTFTCKFFLILHGMRDNNDLKLMLEVSVVKNFFSSLLNISPNYFVS